MKDESIIDFEADGIVSNIEHALLRFKQRASSFDWNTFEIEEILEHL